MGRSIIPAGFLLLLMQLFIWQYVMHVEAALCKGPSKLFHGVCVNNENCATLCEKEGYLTGACKGLKCICSKDCGGSGGEHPIKPPEGPPESPPEGPPGAPVPSTPKAPATPPNPPVTPSPSPVNPLDPPATPACCCSQPPVVPSSQLHVPFPHIFLHAGLSHPVVQLRHIFL